MGFEVPIFGRRLIQLENFCTYLKALKTLAYWNSYPKRQVMASLYSTIDLLYVIAIQVYQFYRPRFWGLDLSQACFT